MIEDKIIIEAIKKNISIRAVLIEIGLSPKGGNYQTIKNVIKKHALDTSHFMGMGHLKGKTHDWSIKQPLSEILIVNSKYTNNDRLRKRLIKEGYKKHQCECCKNSEWLGKPISIELEHVNGVHTDNRIENLMILCPNCHAQTPTYRGKNKGA